jgi:2-C-methyl-D-erythritol 4-phosphate cytidylyltransferase
MTIFSVLLLTAPPPMTGADPSGAFVKVDGRESLLKSVELFLNRDNVKQIQICFTPEQAEEAKRKHAPHLSFSGVKVLIGGPKWMDQMAAAAGKIAADCTHVMVHDAARPGVPYTDLEALMEAAEKGEAAALVAAVKTALVEVDEGGNGLAVAGASSYLQMLSPMVYSKAKFEQMASSRQEPHISQIRLVKGSGLNVRAGGGDAGLVKAMIGLMPKPKVRAAASPFEEAQW